MVRYHIQISTRLDLLQFYHAYLLLVDNLLNFLALFYPPEQTLRPVVTVTHSAIQRAEAKFRLQIPVYFALRRIPFFCCKAH